MAQLPTGCLHRADLPSRNIRQQTLRSQANMVGARRKWLAVAAMPARHDKLNNRLRAQRRTVQASGSRAGSLQCGAACSAEAPPPIRSQASFR
ncbi:MAG TPA: hypothetical protein VHZ55_26245, partial [Bryobacteraceae bacterium]|nr:hypothetical protein [Bryobacteraceae bacterium]